MAKTALLLALVAVLVGGMFVAGVYDSIPGNITVVTSTPTGATPATTAPITTGTTAAVVTAVAPFTPAPLRILDRAERDRHGKTEREPNATRTRLSTPTAVRTSYVEQDSAYTGGSSSSRRRAGHVRPPGQVTLPIVTGDPPSPARPPARARPRSRPR